MSSVNSVVGTYTALSNFKNESQISVAVLGKQLDAQKQQGEAAVQLLEAAAHVGKSLHTGKKIDVKA